MGSEKLSMEEIVEYYKPDVESLAAYIPWLTAQKGAQTSKNFTGEGIEENSIAFPVYDSTLLAFVRTAQQSSLIDRNYVYVYSRNRIRTLADERRFIQNATIREMDELWGILSKYILKGMTKANVWTEGVKNGIYLELLQKMRELLNFWDKQAAER